MQTSLSHRKLAETSLSKARLWAALILFVVPVWFLPPPVGPVAHLLTRAWRAIGLPLPAQVSGEISPSGLIAGTFVFSVLMFAATLVAAAIAGRSLSDFRLRPLLLARAMKGFASGIGVVAVVMVCLLLCRAVRIVPADLAWKDAVAFAVAWLVGMSFVGIGEELSTRGAPLALLSELTNPWIGCTLTAIAFAAAHLANPGESLLGLAQVALFGFVCALSVIRTGTIWWAIGFHAGWDWMLENVFGAVGSGMRFQGSLLVTTGTGPDWLTGGSAGPEGSVFSWLVLLALGCFFVLRRPDAGHPSIIRRGYGRW